MCFVKQPTVLLRCLLCRYRERLPAALAGLTVCPACKSPCLVVVDPLTASLPATEAILSSVAGQETVAC